jgi:hypothetical protein
MLITLSLDTAEGFGASYSPKIYLLPNSLKSHHKVGNTALKMHLFLCFQMIPTSRITMELKNFLACPATAKLCSSTNFQRKEHLAAD